MGVGSGGVMPLVFTHAPATRSMPRVYQRDTVVDLLIIPSYDFLNLPLLLECEVNKLQWHALPPFHAK